MTGKTIDIDDFHWVCSVCGSPRKVVSMYTAKCKHCIKLTIPFAVAHDSTLSRRDIRIGIARKAGAMRTITSSIAKALGVSNLYLTERIGYPRCYQNFTTAYVSAFSYPGKKTKFTLRAVPRNYDVMDSITNSRLTMRRLESKEEKKATLVRIPGELKSWLSMYCAETEQSMTFVIVSLLEQLKHEREAAEKVTTVTNSGYVEV